MKGTDKTSFVMIVALLFGLSLVNAITQQEIDEAKSLIDSKADCKNLSDSQLEIIGEYYMEQMHPGEAHGLMHKMMGLEEGSGTEAQFHIQMAKSLYCGEPGGMMGSGGMIGMTPTMMDIVSGNMMGGQTPTQTNLMENLWYFGYGNLVSGLYVILLIGLIILVYLWIVRLWQDMKKKGGKK